MVDIVQYYGDSDSGTIGIQIPVPFAGVAWTCMEILKFTTVTRQESLIGPHSVRVPSKTAIASATCPLGPHSNDVSHR